MNSFQRQREGEDAGRQDAGHRDRQDDVDHRLPARGAVDAGALLELLRDRLEVAHHQPGAERDQEGRIGEDQRPRRVAEPEVADDLGQRDEQQGLRHQVGDEDHGAEAAGAREVEPRQRIARQHAAEQRDQGRGDRDEHRVEHPAAEVRLLEQVGEVLERRLVGPERLVVHRVPRPVQLAVGTEAGDDHPVEREEQHEDEQDQRDVVEHPLPPDARLSIIVSGPPRGGCRAAAPPRSGTGTGTWRATPRRPATAVPCRCLSGRRRSRTDGWRWPVRRRS